MRVGGNAVLPRETNRFDRRFLMGVAGIARTLSSEGRKLVVVPGGIGGQVFIDWARDAGCSEALQNRVGCKLIDLAAEILADALQRLDEVN